MIDYVEDLIGASIKDYARPAAMLGLPLSKWQ